MEIRTGEVDTACGLRNAERDPEGCFRRDDMLRLALRGRGLDSRDGGLMLCVEVEGMICTWNPRVE